MRLWKMLLIWMAQLGVIGTFFQVLAWLYGFDVQITDFLAVHRDWVTLTLFAYFACFAIWYLGSSEAAAARDISKEADDK